MTPPDACPICGAGGPTPQPVPPAQQQQHHLQALWRYDCGHRYGIYAPEPVYIPTWPKRSRKRGGKRGGKRRKKDATRRRLLAWRRRKKKNQ